MLIKCKAFFEANSHDQIGFYGPENEPQRRIRNHEEFMYDWNEVDPPEVKEREVLIFDVVQGKEVNHRKVTKNFIGKWIEVLKVPKKMGRPPKVKDGDQHLLNA